MMISEIREILAGFLSPFLPIESWGLVLRGAILFLRRSGRVDPAIEPEATTTKTGN